MPRNTTAPPTIVGSVIRSLKIRKLKSAINTGYDISTIPASVAFLLLIESPIQISAQRRTTSVSMKYTSNVLDDSIAFKSALKCPEKYE